ncbi:hypothetical protein Lfu02_55000 [Longispora fulva]|uniref:Major capsid protein n=1 Tax=Longispora fulva TaxID=619741 RepID=A0A8J7GSL7_9ACTN|nr:P22 phage major capsid protein family protein [Longispora fulva]MBG6137518.1 hypothetical protein [Longispora fulva]GIG61128.1 hypothetical protein Lfu02_55000 [Longispora fulva]
MPQNTSHTFIKPETLVSGVVGILDREIILPGLVQRSAGADFAGAAGDVINIKRPARLVANETAMRGDDVAGQLAPRIFADNLVQQKMQVKLDKHFYSAVDLTDEQLTLDLSDFGNEVLAPQAQAIAEKLEILLKGEIEAVEGKNFIAAGAKLSATTEKQLLALIVKIRKALNQANVPARDRVLLIGTDVEEILLNSDLLNKQNESGTSETLRNGQIGRLKGFDIVVSNVVKTNLLVGFHKSAFFLVTQAPVVPTGVTYGAGTAYKGLAARYVRDYNSETASDRSLVSTFAGVATTVDQTVKTTGTGASRVHSLNPPAVVRACAVTFTPES